MPSESFIAKLTEQIGNELGAHVQYLAVAAWYDGETLPNLATIFYGQAREEHNHAMMMVRYLLDVDAVPVTIPGVAAPTCDFPDLVAPVALALEQEKRVTEQIKALAAIARETADPQSANFMDWFLKEQVEEVSKMSDLLTTARRGLDSPLQLEQILAAQATAGDATDPTAPPVAGGGI